MSVFFDPVDFCCYNAKGACSHQVDVALFSKKWNVGLKNTKGEQFKGRYLI